MGRGRDTRFCYPHPVKLRTRLQNLFEPGHGAHLYIIQSHTTGAFKIGRSSDPERRLQEIQVGSPFRCRLILVLPNQGHLEKTLHQQLKNFWSQGEWFLEPGLASLPDAIYELLDLDTVNTWWVGPSGPTHTP